MSARTWLYGRLTSPGAIRHISGRVFAKKSMTSSVETTPFIVYKLGNNTNEALAETVDASRQFLQIFIHDFSDNENADYMKIDDIVEDIKTLLQNASSPADRVITVQYLETSQDLNDETMGTVMKYVRLQMIIGG